MLKQTIHIFRYVLVCLNKDRYETRLFNYVLLHFNPRKRDFSSKKGKQVSSVSNNIFASILIYFLLLFIFNSADSLPGLFHVWQTQKDDVEEIPLRFHSISLYRIRIVWSISLSRGLNGAEFISKITANSEENVRKIRLYIQEQKRILHLQNVADVVWSFIVLDVVNQTEMSRYDLRVF